MIIRSYIEIIVIGLIIGIALNLQPLILLAIWTLMIIGAAALWRRYALRRMTVELCVNALRIPRDGTVTLTTEVINKKLLPLTSLRLKSVAPSNVILTKGTLSSGGRPDLAQIEHTLSIRWYEAVMFHHEIRCPERGLYLFGPMIVNTGDPFGFFEIESDAETYARVLVLPDLLPPQELGLEPRALSGAIRTAQRLITDPARPVGVRDYRRDDPFKTIHWPATARRGELQTRTFEPSTELGVVCMLNITTFDHVWQGVDRQQAELMISAAATVCSQLIAAGHAVGLWSNAAPQPGGYGGPIAPRRGPTQTVAILDQLAQASLYPNQPIDRLIKAQRRQLPHGAAAVILSATAPPALVHQALSLRQRGHPVVWLDFSTGPAPKIPGVIVRKIRPKEAL